MDFTVIEKSENAPLLSTRYPSEKSSTSTYKTCEFSDEDDWSASISTCGKIHPDSEQYSNDSSDEVDYEDFDNKSLPSMMDGVAEEFRDVTEAVLGELHKADEDHHYMIEMGLTRGLSILNDDVVEASGVYGGEEDKFDLEEGNGEVGKEPSASPISIPWSAYLLLASAIIAMSTVGPLLQLQDDATATMKVLWRMIGTSIALAPLALIDVWKHNGGTPHLTIPQWCTFFLSTFFFVVMAIGFCLSLDYTSVGNAVILSNSLALILLVGRLCTCAPVTPLELAGAMVAFCGAILCSRDSASAAAANDGGAFATTLIGDMLALISAIGGVGYVVFAKASRTHLPLCTFMFLTMFYGTLMVLFFQVAILGEKVTWDCDPFHGIGGFLVGNRFDRLPLELVVVVICNLAGTMGYVRAMPHFDSLVICSVQLLEPVIAEFFSYFAGVGALPGWMGWIGNAAVAMGTFVVLYESQKQPTKEVD
jgi:drug/metabolite transporter (DMT)-like permease